MRRCQLYKKLKFQQEIICILFGNIVYESPFKPKSLTHFDLFIIAMKQNICQRLKSIHVYKTSSKMSA